MSIGKFKMNAFPLTKGNISLESGTFTSTNEIVFLCEVDGSLTITWKDGSTTVKECFAGDAFTVIDALSVTITSGAFSKA